MVVDSKTFHWCRSRIYLLQQKRSNSSRGRVGSAAIRVFKVRRHHVRRWTQNWPRHLWGTVHSSLSSSRCLIAASHCYPSCEPPSFFSHPLLRFSISLPSQVFPNCWFASFTLGMFWRSFGESQMLEEMSEMVSPAFEGLNDVAAFVFRR